MYSDSSHPWRSFVYPQRPVPTGNKIRRASLAPGEEANQIDRPETSLRGGFTKAELLGVDARLGCPTSSYVNILPSWLIVGLEADQVQSS